jgi:hypothetical protein
MYIYIRDSVDISVEDLRSVLTCHSVVTHCKVYARSSVVPNTGTASASAVGIKMAADRGV